MPNYDTLSEDKSPEQTYDYDMDLRLVIIRYPEEITIPLLAKEPSKVVWNDKRHGATYECNPSVNIQEIIQTSFLTLNTWRPLTDEGAWGQMAP